MLTALVSAWWAAYVHSFKASLWALLAVAIFVACYTANKLYTAQPYSTGTLHDRQLVALWCGQGLRGGAGAAGRGRDCWSPTLLLLPDSAAAP